MIVGRSHRRELAGLLSGVVVSFSIEHRLERVAAEVATADEPLVVLLDDDAGGEPDQGAVVGEDPDDVGRRPISRLNRSSGLVERSFDQWSGGRA